MASYSTKKGGAMRRCHLFTTHTWACATMCDCVL